MPEVETPSFEPSKLVGAAALLSIAAAIVHGAVTEEHLAEWWGYGVFFIVSALVQGFYGLALVHLLLVRSDPESHARAWDLATRRRFYAAGIAGNGFLIVLYAVTRTMGIPFFGPEAGVIEPVSGAGLLSKALEIALVGVLVVLLRAARGPVGALPPRVNRAAE